MRLPVLENIAVKALTIISGRKSLHAKTTTKFLSEIFKNTFFTGHLWTAASVHAKKLSLALIQKLCFKKDRLRVFRT